MYERHDEEASLRPSRGSAGSDDGVHESEPALGGFAPSAEQAWRPSGVRTVTVGHSLVPRMGVAQFVWGSSGRATPAYQNTTAPIYDVTPGATLGR